MKLARPSLACAVAAALLSLAGGSALAQDGDAPAIEAELETLPSGALDHAVYATLLPDNDAADPTIVQSAISAVLAAHDAKPRSIVPITARKDKPSIVEVRIDPNAVAAPPTRLVLDSNQVVQIHADGMPAPNGPGRDPLVRVLPRQADPNAVTFGARWSAQDRIQAPLLSGLAWDAHADW